MHMAAALYTASCHQPEERATSTVMAAELGYRVQALPLALHTIRLAPNQHYDSDICITVQTPTFPTLCSRRQIGWLEVPRIGMLSSDTLVS